MNRRHPIPLRAALVCVLPLSAFLTGCGRAPAVDIEGSFFPVWMICLIAALFLTFALRYLLVRARIEPHVGPVALFYPSLIVLFTSLIWLVFFR